MTKEELEKEAVEYAEKINLQNVNISGVVRNHISQAYLVGAEPREKRIAELEEENKVLAQNLEDTEILNKTYEKRFDDLKKENAELKKLKRECETSLCRAEYQYNYDQLTNAKELLKQWLQTSKNNSCDNINIVADTEQFISEVEK